jgi:membrane dipeptidase
MNLGAATMSLTAADLHRDATIFDGLIVSNWSRQVFEDMQAAGITAANCTCSIWENFAGTMSNIVNWKAWFRENSDIIMQVRVAEDIARAKAAKKVGIVLGWQNTSAVEDQLGYLEVFHDCGIKVMQFTYNTQNLSGSGCRESRDGGMSDFGRDVLWEMNRLGILCDLSHVGSKTGEDVILASKRPVAFTHVCPAALKENPRNKTDDQLRLIASKGGFVGVTVYPWFLKRGNESTIEDFIETIEYVLALVGEDCVGYGTDFTQGYGNDFLDYIGSDKGYGRRVVPVSNAVFPEGLSSISETPNITETMLRRGWTERRIRKVLGENWVNFLTEAWRK